jgi:hypothetical protein
VFCDGETYPGENTNFAILFVEALQCTDWKTRNVGGSVAPETGGDSVRLVAEVLSSYFLLDQDRRGNLGDQLVRSCLRTL